MTEMATTILLTVLVFGAIITIHELGHFLCAKLFGVKVNEFALGMGPALARFRGGKLVKKSDPEPQDDQTEYVLRAFPVGGFVAMEGENEDSSDARAFCNKPVWQRFIIVIAGAVMNLILGLIVMMILTSSQPLLGTRVIAGFHENAVTSQKLQINDRIVKMNGYRVNGYNDIIFQLLRDQDGVVDFVVERGGQRLEVDEVVFNTTEIAPGRKSINLDFNFYGVPKTFFGTLHYAVDWTISIVKQVWFSLGDILTGRFGFQELSGPVGVAVIVDEARGEMKTQGLRPLLLLLAFITINVGVFNLLPIPALDGGRLLFMLIEMLIGRPINPKYEGYIHAAGFAVLMLLIVAVTFNDIVGILTGRLGSGG